VILTAFSNLKALIFSRHHLLPTSVGKSAARNQAAKSNKKRQQTCCFLPHPLSKICRYLLPFAARRGTVFIAI
jgi:tRNA U34 2-thiouridine synthase MnmA/TrmU